MRPYVSCFAAALRTVLQYRAAALAGATTQIFWGCLRVFVFTAFYAAAARDVPMSLRQTIDYVWLGQALLALTPLRADPTVTAAMRDGTIAYELTRPVDLYGYWYARSLALRVGPAVLRAPLLILFAAFVMPASLCLRAPTSSAALGAFLAAVLLGSLISAAITALISVFTLYTLRGEGLTMLMIHASWLLSGLLIPAPLLPPSFRTLMEWLPFAGMMDLPFRLYVGQLGAGDTLAVLLRQLGWLLALVVLGRKLAGSALRRVVVQGG